MCAYLSLFPNLIVDTYDAENGSLVFSTTSARLKCTKVVDIYFKEPQLGKHKATKASYICLQTVTISLLLQTWTFSDRALNG